MGLCLGVAAAVAAMVGRSQAGAADGTAAPTTEEVRSTYQAYCAVCHGAEGQGTDRGVSLVGVGEAALDFQLSTGRMPLDPIRGPTQVNVNRKPAFPPAMVAGLVRYVSDLTGGHGPGIPVVGPGDVARGGELYRLQCAACHAWSGDGGALYQREAPNLRGVTPVQIAETMLTGPGNMPIFSPGALDRQQVDDVVAYVVQAVQTPDDRGGEPLGHLGPLAEGAIAWVLGLGVIGLFLRWIGTRT